MELNKPSFHIYSDIGFWSYQHVNQMLHHCLALKQFDVEFLHRLVMSPPNWTRLLSLLEGRSRHLKSGLQPMAAPGLVLRPAGKVTKIYNLPSLCAAMDVVNEKLLVWQLNSLCDVAITFVPSRALKRLFDRYSTLIYYCVHDSTMQAYHHRNVDYERELVQRACLVLCDNRVVLARLAQGEPMLDLSDAAQTVAWHGSQMKFILVPPPIPDCFCDLGYRRAEKRYDAVYFGSIHDNIDQAEIARFARAGVRVAVISSQRLAFDSPHLTYFPLQHDFTALAEILASARAILLPYTNSAFMDTVSPAKINQALATGLPVFSSNSKLVTEHGLIPMEVVVTKCDLDCFIESYELERGRSAQLSSYKESVLIGKVVEMILDAHAKGARCERKVTTQWAME
jgi:hypothetical protein